MDRPPGSDCGEGGGRGKRDGCPADRSASAMTKQCFVYSALEFCVLPGGKPGGSTPGGGPPPGRGKGTRPVRGSGWWRWRCVWEWAWV